MASKPIDIWTPYPNACAYTRNGMHVVRLRHTSDEVKYPYVGYVFELGRECSWRSSGHALVTRAEHPLDLVAEWDVDIAVRQSGVLGSFVEGDEILVRFRVARVDADGLPVVLIHGSEWKPLAETVQPCAQPATSAGTSEAS